MIDYICVTKCQHRGRVYSKGEKLQANESEKLPGANGIGYFKKAKHQPVIEVEKPLTMSAITTENDKFEVDALATIQAPEVLNKDDLMKLNKDDLIAKATKLGLSKDRDLIALVKSDISDLIIEASTLN